MNTTELKALAEKATPGPWVAEDWASTDNDGAINVCGTSVTAPQALCGIFTVALEGDDLSDVEYIAAANPAAILELIAAHEDAQGEIRALRATEAGLLDRLAQVEAEHAALLKAISDAEPVAWINEEQTIGPNFLKRHLSFGKYFSDNPLHYKHIPLYTLNGIKP